MLNPGTVVVAYLKEPREQIWGVLLKLEGTGLLLRGIDLHSFDDFLKQAGSGSAGAESQGIDLSTVYYPATRLEKILLDEPTGAIPSLRERFRARAGMEITDYLGLPHDAQPAS